MKHKYDERKIRSLSAREAVRLRPNLYFEKVYTQQSLDQIALEIACHAIDEILDGNCKTIKYTIAEKEIELQYDAGMSLEGKDEKTKAELIMTSLFACRNEKKHLEVGKEFCELGMATINFACEYCHLETIYNGKKGIFVFEEGVLKTKEIEVVNDFKSFTKIRIRPDQEIFDGLSFSYDGIRKKTELLSKKFDGIKIHLQ